MDSLRLGLPVETNRKEKATAIKQPFPFGLREFGKQKQASCFT